MKIGGLVEQRDLALYSITSLPDKPGAAAQVLSVFSDNNINLYYITEGSSDDGTAILSFCVTCDDKEKVDNFLREEKKQNKLRIKKIEYVALLGVFGPHFREKPAIAAKFCDILGKAGINILGISSSISTVSCVIDVKEFDDAQKVILQEFDLP